MKPSYIPIIKNILKSKTKKQLVEVFTDLMEYLVDSEYLGITEGYDYGPDDKQGPEIYYDANGEDIFENT